MWRGRVGTFRPLSSSSDPAMRVIGERGMEAAEEGLERALKAERAAAVQDGSRPPCISAAIHVALSQPSGQPYPASCMLFT